jgi:hypothetical protein
MKGDDNTYTGQPWTWQMTALCVGVSPILVRILLESSIALSEVIFFGLTVNIISLGGLAQIKTKFRARIGGDFDVSGYTWLLLHLCFVLLTMFAVSVLYDEELFIAWIITSVTVFVSVVITTFINALNR